MENIPNQSQENMEIPINPNRIHEILSMGDKLPTSPDKVYRGVQGDAAIRDLFESGIVRNKYSAGVSEKNRWDDAVYWNKGREGAYHPISENRYVIEAPLSVAEERSVTKEDITAIYKEINSEVVDILKNEEGVPENSNNDRQKYIIAQDEKRMNEVRNKLGI